MWQAAGDAARAAGRFARRHRRAIVVGGVVGAAACVYHSMKRALKEAEDEHAAMLVQAGHDARRRQCMSRTRGECVAALTNFLPALRKRLFLAVDVTGPVRELKALRTGMAGATAAAAAAAATKDGGAGGGTGSSSSGSGGGGSAVADGSAAAEAEDLQSREVELWEQVKVTALTRLVVSLYAFNALALMLHMQLHILGRLSLEESQELLLRRTNDDDITPGSSTETAASLPDGNPGMMPSPSPPPTTTTRNGVQIPPPPAAVRQGAGASDWSGGAATAGLALSMEARHSLLSSTYEHVLGDGLRALVRDVERAVSRCTCSWKAHTRQQVEFQDLVAVIRRVRREVEGPIGGSAYYGGGGDFYGGGAAVGEGLGRSSGVRHALLLRYIINPSDGIGGMAAAATTTAPAPTNDTTLEGVIANGTGTGTDTASAGGTAGVRNGGASSLGGGAGVGGAAGGVLLQGAGEVLDETWDTAESPNFAAALQARQPAARKLLYFTICLDATFGMVYEQLRQKAFCRGSTTGGGRRQHRGAAAAAAGSEDAGGGRAAGPPSELTAPPSEPAGATTGPAVGTSGDGGGLPAGAAAAHAAGGGGTVGFVAAAPAVAEREESAQVLATVISQAKLVVSEILEASPGNEYAHAVASLPSVQDLCFSVFSGGAAAAAAGGTQLHINPVAAAGPRGISSPHPNAAARSGGGVGDVGFPPQEPLPVGSAGGFGGGGIGVGGGDSSGPLLGAGAARRPAR
ncbi:unnamed protein product [Ectocarpus sp. 13 AM-2016]